MRRRFAIEREDYPRFTFTESIQGLPSSSRRQRLAWGLKRSKRPHTDFEVNERIGADINPRIGLTIEHLFC